ncbi:DUF2238 domain-containing protein [bacterium]|nr:DUF2238 domain-containing protein [candidate division CSSED10-310 bacterium]
MILIWSGIRPVDFYTWILEVLPAVAGVAILIAIYPRFKFTRLVYSLILIHAAVLCVGGHYTYARVPLFDWIKQLTGATRNHYDRVGHFVQGFIPAMIAREVFIRKSPVKKGWWLFCMVVFFALSLSAFYELIEWWVAEATGTAAEAFLGTQGDIWDTQWDMFLALLGAVISQLLLSRVHDRLMANEGRR